MSHTPLLSVVIPTYNHEAYIRRTLDSVLEQGIDDMEILVYDDCSTDKTAEIVSSYLHDDRISLVRQPGNLGPKPNSQQALDAARGRYLVWLSGDDWFYAGHFRSGLEVLEANPGVALVYSPCYWVDTNDRIIRVMQHPGHPPHDYTGGRNEVAELLASDNYITPSSAIFRTKWFHEAGAFDVDIRGGDWDLFIRIARGHPDFAFLSKPGTAYRIHDGQCSHAIYRSTDPLHTHLRVLEKTLDSPQAECLINHVQPILKHLERRVVAYKEKELELFSSRIVEVCEKLSALTEKQSCSGEPLVSVVVPTYNRPELLQDALRSLVGQEYGNWEAVVVNDAGADVSALVESIDPQRRIRYLRHTKNCGLPTARNTAIRFSRGEIICYLDDDDTFLPHHLDTVVDALMRNRASFVYTEAEYIQERVEDGIRNELDRSQPYSGIEYSKGRLHVANYIPVNTWAHRRELLSHSGLFDTELNAFEDWDLLIRFSRLVDFVHIPQVTVEVHMRLSSAQDQMTQYERKHYPSLYKKIYARYSVEGDEILLRLRELQLGALDKERSRSALEELGEAWSDVIDDIRVIPDPFGMNYTQDNKPCKQHLDSWLTALTPPEATHTETSLEQEAAYRKWMEAHSLQECDVQRFTRRMMTAWTIQPSIHLVMTHVPGQKEALADTLDSLGAQLYGGWGLSIISNSPCPDPAFEDMDMLEWNQVEGDLIVGVNAVVEASGADWLGLLEAGSILAPHVLYRHVEHLHQHPEWRLVYMDEDRVDDNGEHYDPLFKPEFNLELLRAIPYMGKFILMEREALLAAGAYGQQTGAEAYDAAFRVIEQFGEQAVGHIPDVLIHCQDRFQLALDQDLVEANRRVSVTAHLKRCSIDGEAKPGVLFGSCFVDYACDDTPPVEIIVPVNGRPEALELFLDSLLSQTQYPDFRVRLLIRDTVEIPAALLARDNVDVASYPQSGVQWQEMLELAYKSDIEYLMLMSPGAIVIQPNWLERLVAHFQKPNVAVVAPRLVASDKTLVGGGIIIGAGSYSVGMGAFGGLALEDPGYMGRAQVAQELSAVSASCMLVRRSVFESIDGLLTSLKLPFYQAVEFCLRVRETGKKIVWTPHSTLMFIGEDQPELEAVDLDELVVSEFEAVCRKSLSVLANDPAYNPNLKLSGERFAVDDNFVPPWSSNDHALSRIIGFGAGSIGSWKFRVQQPLNVMHREQVANTLVLPFTKGLAQWPSSVELERLQANTLLMHNTMHDIYMDTMEAYKRVNGAFMVFSQDDLMFALPPKNPFFRTGYKDVRKRLRKCLSIADRVIVTTEPLAEELRTMADDVRVVLNYLDEAVWGDLSSERATSAKPRVGWAGAQQHLGDLELLEEVVRETAHEVDWIFFGMCPDFLQPYVKEIHNHVTFGKYPEKLATLNLDLAVAPLEHNRFNDSKSNLRIVEYGALGWPVVASDIAPYREGPVCRVPNQPRAWIKAIRERIHDMDATRREGDVLLAWVRENWFLQQHMNNWLAALDPAGDAGRWQREQGRAAGL